MIGELSWVETKKLKYENEIPIKTFFERNEEENCGIYLIIQ